MGIREFVNKRPEISSLGILILVALAVWYLFSQMTSEVDPGRQFYTDDDGKTFFSDVAGLPVPMERNGKTIVMAEVFEVKGRKFVAYMRRYTPAALEQLRNKGTPLASTKEGAPAMTGLRVEYKKPGDPKWHDIDGDVKAMAAYLNLSSPEGDLTQVAP